MLTRLVVRNFKRLEEANIPLGKTVVFIGPNNLGKTTALQALMLWDVGVRAWSAKREEGRRPRKRPGVTINRQDLTSMPVPAASLLWSGLHVRRKARGDSKGTQNIRIDLVVSGVTQGKEWECGLEFDYANEESLICRPLRMPGQELSTIAKTEFSSIPSEALQVGISILPPMSGLTPVETPLLPGRISVLLGQGETAQVLRNLCYQLWERDGSAPARSKNSAWGRLAEEMHRLFGIELQPPRLSGRKEIILEYKENRKVLDISSSGRGMQQVLLLLAHFYWNPQTVLLLDEPDAHLEILRQREIFQVLSQITETQGSQLIAASHSEVLLNEAAGRGVVVAFVGSPHLLNPGDRGSQLLKSLTELGWDQYYQAEQSGWVLYLEGPSDLEILRSFARTLGHVEAQAALNRPFVKYVATNVPEIARGHFWGLKEANPGLFGVAIFDRIPKELKPEGPLRETMWKRREIENYFCTEEVLMEYARGKPVDDLFGAADREDRQNIMKRTIRDVVQALETLDRPEMKPWSVDIKASDDFLDVIFKKYFEALHLPLLLRKGQYSDLAALMPAESIDAEIREKLGLIADVARRAQELK